MERRKYILSLGAAALSGCLSSRQEPRDTDQINQSSTQPDESTSITEQSTGTSTASLPTSIEEARLSFQFQKLSEATAESPAEVQLRLTNHGGARDINFIGSAPLSAEFVGDGPIEDGILLHPQDIHNAAVVDDNDDNEFNVVPDSREGDCWNRVDIPHSPANNGFQVSLSQGETFSNTYFVLANEQNNCPPAGEYSFESKFYLPDSNNVELVWEFSLEYPISTTGQTE
ncbi:hypothetical protein [Haloarchaeobius sp. FL176]|uniref:hypothetical protein n=1 Tax=Haloarchaeobius sp. FL176 TaxID=2967129 RepID=UPI00214880F9|nr:hypothetical protein [Haloarchaeobius sp. FL176]